MENESIMELTIQTEESAIEGGFVMPEMVTSMVDVVEKSEVNPPETTTCRPPLHDIPAANEVVVHVITPTANSVGIVIFTTVPTG
jgi:hypothetical protein